LTQSLISKLYPPHVIPLQRVVEDFDGDALDERWQVNNISGANTFAMVDEIDEGFKMVCQVAVDATPAIDFNNKRQYEPTGCIMVAEYRSVTINGNQESQVGFNSNNTTTEGDHFARVGTRTSDGFVIRTNDGGVASTTTMNATEDTNWHTYEMILRSSDVQASREGILESTKTNDLPTLKLQPRVMTATGGSPTANEVRVRYFEAYNT